MINREVRTSWKSKLEFLRNPQYSTYKNISLITFHPAASPLYCNPSCCPPARQLPSSSSATLQLASYYTATTRDHWPAGLIQWGGWARVVVGASYLYTLHCLLQKTQLSLSTYIPREPKYGTKPEPAPVPAPAPAPQPRRDKHCKQCRTACECTERPDLHTGIAAQKHLLNV